MDKEQHCAAKAQLVAQMQAGKSWQAAAVTAGVQISQSTAYRLLQVVRIRGEAALQLARLSLLLASASWAGTGPAGRGFPAICATRSPMTSDQRTRTGRASGMRNPMAPMSTG